MIHQIIYFNTLTSDYLWPQVTANRDQSMTAFLATPQGPTFASATLSESHTFLSVLGLHLERPPCDCHSVRGSEPPAPCHLLPLCSNTVETNYKEPLGPQEETWGCQVKHRKTQALAVVGLRVGLLKLQNSDPSKTSFLKKNLHPQTEQNEEF